MPVIKVRVSKELKERMERLEHVDWNEVIIHAIIEKINMEEGRKMAKAVLISERIRKSVSPGGDTTNIIRDWREKRRSGYD